MKKRIGIASFIFFMVLFCHVVSFGWSTNSTDADLANSAASYPGREWPINYKDVGNQVTVFISNNGKLSTPTIYRPNAFCVGETYGTTSSGSLPQKYKITSVVKMRGKQMSWWSEAYRSGKTQEVATNNMAYHMSQIAYCAYKAEMAKEGKVSPDYFENTWKSVLKYTFKEAIQNGKFAEMRMGQ